MLQCHKVKESKSKIQPYIYLQIKKWHSLHRVTSNISKRIYEHKNHLIEGFSDKYDVTTLVWYELHEQ